MLAGYDAIYQSSGPRTIITGYGGNYIVKVRMESLYRYLFQTRNFSQLKRELSAISASLLRHQIVRFLANIADGQIRLVIRDLAHRHPTDFQHAWLNPVFGAQFPAFSIDPFYGMTHTQERALIPIFWGWEYRVRCLDIIARTTQHAFYDPLFDMEVYDFCACIPPQYFLDAGEYRPIYKDALTPLLPAEIIHHPKCQSFDSLMHEGIAIHASSLVKQAINNSLFNDVFDRNKLSAAYEQYRHDVEQNNVDDIYGRALWLSLSTILWAL